MALSSAMYAAVTGLSALGTGMQTISNNIANVNTVGFKAGRTNYEDLISQNYFSGGRVNQRGCGVKVSSIQSMFTQGAFMSSAQDTDMAIAGDGFFSVRNTITNTTNYTRAGVFTLSKDGYLEDPSGNILQGWQMSIPKPGQEPVRIGAPTDIKIIVINAPPVETSQIKIVTNLNADDTSAYIYQKYQLAVDYADGIAKPIAQSAQTAMVIATWNPPAKGGTDVPPSLPGWPVLPPAGYSQTVTPSNAAAATSITRADQFLIDDFNTTFGINPPFSGPVNNIRVFADDSMVIADAQRSAGWMTKSEFDAFVTQVEGQMEAYAEAKGKDEYTQVYRSRYDSAYTVITSKLEQWQLEGNGFADAWDASKKPYIDPENYTHPEPITIYDSLGSAHKLMIYYQPNPIMENVWDYIITCDPLEDARKDGNLSLLFSETATFSGLIQKGKITFSGDGTDRHGGVIKDIEAQNLDLNHTKMAVTDPTKSYAGTTTRMKTAAIGGYYTGSPTIDLSSAQTKDGGVLYKATPRDYTITWGGQTSAYNHDYNTWYANMSTWCAQPGPPPAGGGGIDPTQSASQAAYVTSMAALGTPDPKPVYNDPTYWNNYGGSPPSSGFTWTDGVNSKFIPIKDVNNPGPYDVGSGLTITFDKDMLPLHFGQPGSDHITVKATSEQIAWTNLKPNDTGYFDFDVAFVQSASMATHPPYPPDMPTITQNIAFDMGAKYHGTNPKWELDEMSTTQYAAENSTAFSGQDGYPAGSLQRVSIGEDGVVTGIYSNGRHQPLYQVGLTRFLNPWGLSKEGDNLFAETRYSGSGALNPPGYGGTGTILANFLEQSNVDLAEEIVNMIVTQRGFQANSKTVTTTDTMLAEVIEMKR